MPKPLDYAACRYAVFARDVIAPAIDTDAVTPGVTRGQ